MKNRFLLLWILSCFNFITIYAQNFVNVGDTGYVIDESIPYVSSLLGYWHYDSGMNPDRVFTLPTPIVNSEGSDGVLLVKSAGVWGKALRLRINGVTKEIQTLIPIQLDSEANFTNTWQLYAGLFELSDFGVALGDSVTQIQILASTRASSSAYRANYGNPPDPVYGNFSDTMFYGLAPIFKLLVEASSLEICGTEVKPYEIDVLSSDINETNIQTNIISPLPTNGSVMILADGRTVEYTPFNGTEDETDIINLEVCDITLTSTCNTISVPVIINRKKTSPNCDFDDDGIINSIDIDDDNDGITDIIEDSTCAITPLDKNLITITSDFSWYANANFPDKLLDEDNIGTGVYPQNGIDLVNQTYLQFDFSYAVVINAIELLTHNNGSLQSGSTLKIQGSDDANNWVDVSDTITPNIAVGVITANPKSHNFQFNNEIGYRYYRIYGVSGKTNNWWMYEIYFNQVLINCNEDGDNYINSLDLDSDDDGCSDAFEAGHTSSNPNIINSPGPYGANGLSDSLETFPESDNLNYIVNQTDAILNFLDNTVNECPVISDNINAALDIANTLINIPVSGNVLTNDSTQPEGLDIEVTSLTPTPDGFIRATTNEGVIVILSPNGDYTYTPPTDYVGEDSFEYTICEVGDPTNCDTTKVYIEIIDNKGAANKPPVANPDALTTLTNVPVTSRVLVNDFDPDGDTITVTTPSVVTNEGVTVTINPTTGEFIYTPPTDFIGEDQFTYTICDNQTPQLCDTTTVIIAVVSPITAGNITVANDDNYAIRSSEIQTGDVGENDFDPEGHSLADPAFTLTSGVNGGIDPTYGTLTFNTNGTFEFVPNTTLIPEGTLRFTYEVCDAFTPQACDEATVEIVVVSPPDFTVVLEIVDDIMLTDNSREITLKGTFSEINNRNATLRPIFMSFENDSRYTTSFDQTLTTFDGSAIDNSNWEYTNSTRLFRYINNRGVYQGQTTETIIFKVTFNNLSALPPGKLTRIISIISSSGGEVNQINNVSEIMIELN